jgi:hypothetical protein
MRTALYPAVFRALGRGALAQQLLLFRLNSVKTHVGNKSVIHTPPPPTGAWQFLLFILICVVNQAAYV